MYEKNIYCWFFLRGLMVTWIHNFFFVLTQKSSKNNVFHSAFSKISCAFIIWFRQAIFFYEKETYIQKKTKYFDTIYLSLFLAIQTQNNLLFLLFHKKSIVFHCSTIFSTITKSSYIIKIFFVTIQFAFYDFNFRKWDVKKLLGFCCYLYVFWQVNIYYFF